MKARRGGALFIFLFASLLYVNTLGHGFHYDDFHSVVHNPHIRSLGNLPDFFTDPRTFSADPQQAMYRPVLLVTYALNYTWGADEPLGYHLVNILLHGANAALVVLLVGALLGDGRLSLLAGLLFAVTPLNSEAVNYISSRSELLMAFFYLLACLSYARFARTRDWQKYGIALVAGALALATKSVAVTLVGGLVLCDWLSGSWGQVKERKGYYLGFAILDIIYLVISRSLIGKALGEPVRSLGAQAWTQLKAGVYYLLLGAMPVKLSVEHQFSVARSPGEAVVIAAGLMLGSLLFLLIRSRARWIPFAGGWMILLLGPTVIVPLIVLVNEHRLYLAGVGWCLLLAWSLKEVATRRRGVAWLGVGVYTIILACIAFQRNQVWADELSLWSDAAARGPLMLKPHLRRGDALMEQDRLTEAEAAYQRAVALRPQHPGARNNLGRLYMQQGRRPEAEKEFRVLLQAAPGVAPARLNLAGLLLRQGRWEEAEAEYRRVLDFDDTRGIAQKHLGHIVLQYRDDPAAALAYYDQALALDSAPDAAFWCGRGVAFKALGRLAEAEEAYQQALASDAEYIEAWFNLGNLYRENGRLTAAIGAYAQVVALGGGSGLTRLAGEQMESLTRLLQTQTNPNKP